MPSLREGEWTVMVTIPVAALVVTTVAAVRGVRVVAVVALGVQATWRATVAAMVMHIVRNVEKIVLIYVQDVGRFLTVARNASKRIGRTTAIAASRCLLECVCIQIILAKCICTLPTPVGV